MKNVRIYDRFYYDHFVVIVRDGKAVKAEKKSTLPTFERLAGEMLSYLEPLNKGIKSGPYYDLWMCRDRGRTYEYKGFMWSHGNWVEVDGGAPSSVESMIEGLKG